MLVMEDTREEVRPGVDLAVIVEPYIAKAQGRTKIGKGHLRQIPPDPTKDPLGALRYHLASASQDEVAKIVGTQAPTISRWERTGRAVTPSRRKDLAALYGVPDHILEDIEWHIRRRESAKSGESPTLKPVKVTKVLLARRAADLDDREAQVALRERNCDKRVEELQAKATNITHQITGMRFKVTGLLAALDMLGVVVSGIADEVEECRTPSLRIA